MPLPLAFRPAGALALAAALLLLVTSRGQSVAQELDPEAARLVRRGDVALALSTLASRHPQVLAWQRALAEIPAPTGEEGDRARYMQRQFALAGVNDVRIDETGNVVASLAGGRERPRLLLSAHLDTTYPPGTPVEISEEGGRLVGPGIHDDARGLAVLLGLAEAFARGEPPLEASLLFACTVGEEGLGDLRGMKALFAPGGAAVGVDYVINVDGPGMDRIVTRGLGSRRYRVTYRGPGGHSWNDFGIVNPAAALGRAIALISELELPQDPRSSLNVGRLGGGTSVNAIPQEAWMEIDLRSEDGEALKALERDVMDALVEALRAEREAARAGRQRLDLDVQLVGDRPAGALQPNALLARAARAATRLFGVDPVASASSTDANVPLSLGIPAVSLGGGGLGGRAHTLEEWFDPAGGEHGLQRLYVLAHLLALHAPPAATR